MYGLRHERPFQQSKLQNNTAVLNGTQNEGTPMHQRACEHTEAIKEFYRWPPVMRYMLPVTKPASSDDR